MPLFLLGRMNVIFRTLQCRYFQLGRMNIGACKYVFLYLTGIF